ncbi:hypothetical protein EMGR_005345 [Emarellia grisea]
MQATILQACITGFLALAVGLCFSKLPNLNQVQYSVSIATHLCDRQSRLG